LSQFTRLQVLKLDLLELDHINAPTPIEPIELSCLKELEINGDVYSLTVLLGFLPDPQLHLLINTSSNRNSKWPPFSGELEVRNAMCRFARFWKLASGQSTFPVQSISCLFDADSPEDDIHTINLANAFNGTPRNPNAPSLTVYIRINQILAANSIIPQITEICLDFDHSTTRDIQIADAIDFILFTSVRTLLLNDADAVHLELQPWESRSVLR
jgi:hypothetical protein